MESVAEDKQITSEITDTQLMFAGNKVFIVDRRYSDFEWLRRTLVTEFPERIIPIIPEKDLLGKYEKETTEYRRRTLNVFLANIVSDPVWSVDTNVERFLKDTDQAFETPLEKSESLFSSFLLAVNTIANDSVVIPEDGDSAEFWFNEKSKYISGLGDNFKNVKLVRDRNLEVEKEKLITNTSLSNGFLDENFVQLLNKNKTGKEIQLFKVYLKAHEEILKEMDNYHRNCFPFQDTLNNQHLMCLEEVRLLEHRRNNEIDVLMSANQIMQKYKDEEEMNTKLKESENNLKELNKSVKYQIEDLLVEKSKLVKLSLIDFVRQNIEIEEKNLALWKELQQTLTPSIQNNNNNNNEEL